MNDIREIEVPETKRYSFPNPLEIIEYKGKWIVVAVNTANWIILDTFHQVEFFKLLKEFNLKEALERFHGDPEDAEWVVTQLEARQFEHTERILKHSESGVHLYLTNECNMRCPHCYMFAGKKESNELSVFELKNLITQLAENGVKCIVLSGGEPLVHPEIKTIVRHCSQEGLEVEILSNGSLWNKSFVDEIAPFLSAVQISVDGYDEESNALIRGKGNFHRALETVEYLLQKGVKTSIAMVPKWSEDIETNKLRYVDFAKQLIRKYEAKPFSFNIVGELWEGRELTLTSEQKVRFEKTVSEIFNLVYGEGSEDRTFISYHREHGIEENCAFGNLSIDSNGDVYLCAQIKMIHPIGNVRIHSVEELMAKANEARKKSEVSNLLPCRSCAIRYICGGECRIKYFTVLRDGAIPKDNQYPQRECSKEYRESFYDLMIRTNHFIFQ